jgi:Na+-driven multidrug efflux pump
MTLQAIAVTFALASPRRVVSLRRASDARRGGRAAYADEGRAMAHVAGPAVLERILYHLGYLGFVFVLGHLGDASMAANQALISAEAICWISADGFGVAAAALVAQKLGAGRPREATRAARVSTGYAIALLSAMGLLFLAARGVVLPIFTGAPDVIAIASSAAPVLAIAQPFMATGVVLGHALRGAGHTRPVLAVSAAGALAVRIGCTWFFAITLGLGLRGIWMGSTCDWLVRSALLVWLGRLKSREAVRAAAAPS